MLGDRYPGGRRQGDLRLRRARCKAGAHTELAGRFSNPPPGRETEAGGCASNLAIIGRYILTPDHFRNAADDPTGTGGEIQLTDGLRALLKKEKIYGYQFEGKRHDAGDKLGFLKATVEFALQESGTRSGFCEVFTFVAGGRIRDEQLIALLLRAVRSKSSSS